MLLTEEDGVSCPLGVCLRILVTFSSVHNENAFAKKLS
jgi:hypothetical protein